MSIRVKAYPRLALLSIMTFLGLLAALGVYQAGNAAHIEDVGDFLLDWGSYGEMQGEFKFPYGIAADSSGRIYVADGVNSRVQKFDSSGGFLRMWGWGVNTTADAFEICTGVGTLCYEGRAGSGAGQLNRPFGIAVDGAGGVYVADYTNNRIVKYSSDGSILGDWGAWGSGPREFKGLFDVAADTKGGVYTVEAFNNRVQKFDSDGDFQLMWGWGVDTGNEEFEICTSATTPCHSGISGSGEGQFNHPKGITAESGYVYVSDEGNDRILIFEDDGAAVGTWGSSGTGHGQFDYPRGLDGNRLGTVLATDSGQERVQRFSGSGDFLDMWGWGVDTGGASFEVCTKATTVCFAGIEGSGAGQFDWPYDLTVGRCGEVYVADVGNHRIQKFSGGCCLHLPLILRKS